MSRLGGLCAIVAIVLASAPARAEDERVPEAQKRYEAGMASFRWRPAPSPKWRAGRARSARAASSSAIRATPRRSAFSRRARSTSWPPTPPACRRCRSNRSSGDINGDGKPDLLVGYQSATQGPHFAWVIYGR